MLAPISKGGKGQPVTITWPGKTVVDPETDTAKVGEPRIEQCSGVEEAYSAFTVGQGLVLAGDVKFLLSPLQRDGTPVTPPVAGLVLAKADGKPWTVVRVDTLAPAGVAVMFTLQLRKGG